MIQAGESVSGVRRLAGLLGLAVLASCGPASTTGQPGAVPVPSVSAVPVAAPAASARGSSVRPSLMTDAPLSARFVDLPTELPDAPCHELLVAVVSGEVTVLGDKLTAGDVLITFHPERTPLTGSGVVVIADSREPAERCGVKARPAPTRAVVRGKSVAPLVWAGGSMQANLDVPVSLSPDVYLGRLAGTAPVAEHAHEGSWEILCAVEAAGTFTLDGVDRRLEKRQIVVIPAGAKHSWKPDPGSRLEGVQLYIPPGPEQRFQALAAAAESRPIPGPRDGRRY